MESVRAGFRESIRNSRSIESCWAAARSSGVTPTFAEHSIFSIRILSMENLPVAFVERFTSGKTGFNVVPEGDAIFAQVPAQINDPPVSQVGKVTKPLVDILDMDTHLLYLI